MNALVAVLIVAGAAFVLIAAIGVVRFPDVLCRMHAATKAGAFGAALLLLAATLHFQTVEVAVKSSLAVVFFYLTAPISGHLLGRAAYRRAGNPAPLTVDEWKTAPGEVASGEKCPPVAGKNADEPKIRS